MRVSTQCTIYSCKDWATTIAFFALYVLYGLTCITYNRRFDVLDVLCSRSVTSGDTLTPRSYEHVQAVAWDCATRTVPELFSIVSLCHEPPIVCRRPYKNAQEGRGSSTSETCLLYTSDAADD